MPKLGKNYNGMLTIEVDDELRMKLLALAYLKRGNRYYAPITRDLLYKAVEAEIEGLSVGEKRDYVRILDNVTLTAVVRRQTEAEKRSLTGQTSEPVS